VEKAGGGSPAQAVTSEAVTEAVTSADVLVAELKPTDPKSALIEFCPVVEVGKTQVNIDGQRELLEDPFFENVNK